MFYLKAALPDRAPATVEQARKQLNALELPEWLAQMACLTKLLAYDLGFMRSAETGEAVLGDGVPVPMWSYGAIEYLMALDLAAFDILELGGGQSTIFLSRRCKSVSLIETNDGWLERLKAARLPNVEFRLAPAGGIPMAMAQLGRPFDVISIDPSDNRYACAKAALSLLKPGGLIILDNSEWYPNTTALLRSNDLIQIDFYDFRPLHHFRTVTSLFLHPAFRPKPRGSHLPLRPIGGRPVDFNGWDQIS